jgi:hypothetical protein
MSEVYQGASPNARLLAGSIATSENNSRRYGNAFSVSLISHVAILLLVLFVITVPVIPTPDQPVVEGHHLDSPAGARRRRWRWRQQNAGAPTESGAAG